MHGVQVQTVPGRGEDRQKMLAQDIGEFVPAAEYVPAFSLITRTWAEFLLLADGFVIVVDPSVLMPGEQPMFALDAGGIWSATGSG